MTNNLKLPNLFIFLFFISLNVFLSSAESKFKMTLQIGNPGGVSKIIYTKDGSMFATANIMNKTIKIWNNKAKLLYIIDNGEDLNICEMAFSPDNKYLAFTNYTYFKIYNLNTGNLITVKGSSDAITRMINGIAFAGDAKSVYIGASNTITTPLPLSIDADEFEANLKKLNEKEIIELQKAYFLDRTENKYKLYLELPDHSNLYTIILKLKYNISNFTPVYSNCIEEWGIDGRYIKKIGEHNNIAGKMISKIITSPDGKNILSTSMDGLIKIWNIDAGLISTVQGSDLYINVCFNLDGKLFGWTSYTGIKVCNLNGVYLININRTMSGSSDIDIDKKLIVEYAYDVDAKKNIIPMLRVRNLNDELQKDIKGIASTGYSVKINPAGTMVVSGTLDGTVNLVNLKNEYTVSLINDKYEWLSYTPDGYWDSSKNGGKLVAMVQDMEAYSVDQFAAKYNRPDIILKRLEAEDDDVINFYYYQYKKRLRKMNLNEEDLTNELHVPEVKIINSKIKEKFIELEFNLNDSMSKLKSYNIYVNDVPVFGTYGKQVKDNNMTITEMIELSSGKNKIEISCLNEKGAESFRALTMADYNKKIKGDLYYIGFGVSKYADPSLALQFADKDAKDFEKVFQKMNTLYNNIYTKTYTNEQVTIENIKKAKDLLKNAKVDDTFVVFIAGHGAHDNDKEATYYFLTYDTDINNLSKNSADFDLVEDLLQGVAPRNKLFLMDTCESGEIDADVKTIYFAMTENKKIKSRGINRGLKINSIANPQIYRTVLFDNDRYIFNNLVRRSGAIVFSSCKGGEYSYESEDIKNGFFTREIINTLTNSNKTGNSTISIDDLKEIVIKAVSERTSGKQNPTVDRDNIYIKFSFPVVK